MAPNPPRKSTALEPRYTIRRRAEKEARGQIIGAVSQVDRVIRALEIAHMEATQLAEGDPHTPALRSAIIADLDRLLANLRATSVQAASHDLPDTKEGP